MGTCFSWRVPVLFFLDADLEKVQNMRQEFTG